VGAEFRVRGVGLHSGFQKLGLGSATDSPCPGTPEQFGAYLRLQGYLAYKTTHPPKDPTVGLCISVHTSGQGFINVCLYKGTSPIRKRPPPLGP
jgi:hypothetical protein